MPSVPLTTPTQILDCVEAAFCKARTITILDRSRREFTARLSHTVSDDAVIQAEVQPLGLTLRTNLAILPEVPLVVCLAAANAMTRCSLLLAVSVDTDRRQFLLELTLPFGRTGCLAEQVSELAEACLRVLRLVPAPLQRFVQGRIGLDRLVVSLVLPGVGFEEADPSSLAFRTADRTQPSIGHGRFSVGD